MADGMIKGLITSRMAGGSIRDGDRGPMVGATASRLVVSVFCLLPSVSCCAEALVDPTRPPASVIAPVAAASGPVESTPSGLRSIIISKTRRAAIIDGETVELGGKHGDARLTEVNEGSVVLRGTQGRQVMTLFPGVKMTSRKEVKPRSPAGKVQSGKQKVRPDERKEEK